MYTYTYTSSNITGAELAALLPGLIIGSLFGIIIGLIINYVLAHKVYEKAGYPGWTAIVPFYNNYILYKMSDINVGFFILSIFLPVINIYLYIELAKKFGKGAGFGVLTFFFAPICLAILGYGSAEFNGTKKSA